MKVLWFEAFRVSPSPVTSETGTGRSLHPFQIDLSRPRDFLSIRGLDNSILDVQLNGKPQLQYFSKSMVGPGFSKKPTFHMSSTGARIVLSERKQKSYVTPPPPCFFYEEKKKTLIFKRDFVKPAPGGVLKPVPLKSDRPDWEGLSPGGSGHPAWRGSSNQY